MRPHSSLRRDSAAYRLFGLLLAAALFAGGCRTTAMKGTPFYEGDHDRREGPSEDRVNLWPIAYYRAPALSVLWPLGEFADDRTVVRPFVSMYRENEDAPYDEINVLWPLAQFDRRSGDNRVFPVFWGDTPDGGSYLNVFPLYDRRCESDGSRSNRLLLGLLGGWRTDAEGEAAEHWLFPLWYRDAEDDTVASLLWAQGDGWTAVPPLLSWRTEEEDGGATTRALLGLGGWRTDADGEVGRSWLFPLWYRDAASDRFLSALWASGRDWSAVPPLLSWRTEEADGGSLTRALLGLGGWRINANGEVGTNWLLPLWYRDATSLYTPLFGHDDSGGDRIDYWLTPLVGARSGDWTGSWFSRSTPGPNGRKPAKTCSRSCCWEALRGMPEALRKLALPAVVRHRQPDSRPAACRNASHRRGPAANGLDVRPRAHLAPARPRRFETRGHARRGTRRLGRTRPH